jgi:hypothetical protein
MQKVATLRPLFCFVHARTPSKLELTAEPGAGGLRDLLGLMSNVAACGCLYVSHLRFFSRHVPVIALGQLGRLSAWLR